MSFIHTSFPVGPLGCNCSILGDQHAGECIVIDPGGDEEVILDWCSDHGLKIKIMIHTHGHFDHILAASAIREKTGAQIALHEGDRWLYENIDLQGQMFGFALEKQGTFDISLEHQQVHQCGCVKVETLFTPGHTPGSVCFHENEQQLLFSGDTLFAGSIGRTDLWGGDQSQLLNSIQDHLKCLDESTQVIPGHGPATTMLRELETNPFLK